MQTVQLEYDKKIQLQNKHTVCNQLQKKLDALQTVRDRLHADAQRDKLRNHRDQTLAEYKQNISYYNAEISIHKKKIIGLKKSVSVKSPKKTMAMSNTTLSESHQPVANYQPAGDRHLATVDRQLAATNYQPAGDITDELFDLNLDQLENKILSISSEIKKLRGQYR